MAGAARLADLSKEAALQAFTATIAKLPEGDWKAADAAAIAARLLAVAAGQSAQAVPAMAVPRSNWRQDEAGPLRPGWLGARLAVAILLVTVICRRRP